MEISWITNELLTTKNLYSIMESIHGFMLMVIWIFISINLCKFNLNFWKNRKRTKLCSFISLHNSFRISLDNKDERNMRDISPISKFQRIKWICSRAIWCLRFEDIHFARSELFSNGEWVKTYSHVCVRRTTSKESFRIYMYACPIGHKQHSEKFLS